MSEERTRWLDRIVLLRTDLSFARSKLIQFLSTTAQKAVDYIGGSMKVLMNMGGYSQTLFAIPPKNITHLECRDEIQLIT